MRLWMKWSAWLCLSLMLWTVGAETTHHHPNRAESATCSICAAAHSASPAVSSSHNAPVFTAIGLFQEQDAVAKARFESSDRGIRGPPAVL
jgi:hypothetical protein